MRVYCTYCSAKKRRDSSLLPAVKRYDSSRIRDIYQLAQADGVQFLILSGEYGLLSPEEEIPYYDHLLRREKVGALVGLVAHQLRVRKVEELVYFTRPLESSPDIRPYHDTISAACSRVGVKFELKIYESSERAEPGNILLKRPAGGERGSWREVMERAEKAKDIMLADRISGETEFQKLLKEYPNDGMVFFKRAEAYEELGERYLAIEDYRRAERLFPIPSWKERAKEALLRLQRGV